MEKDENTINEKFIKKYLPQRIYYNHSNIDIWINLTIVQLLNYDKLLGKDLIQLIQGNKKYNYIENEEQINKEKIELLKKISEGSAGEKSKKDKKLKKNSILGFDIPECELYFIVKLYVDEVERKPQYQTKIIFNHKNINQCIPFKFKYKDLTENSYIVVEIYSVELANEQSFLGKSKINLFNENLNLYQGRHVVKISKNKNDNSNDKIIYTESEKEIEVLINSFYGKEFDDSENYYGEGKDKKGIKISDSKIKIEEIENNYYYNNEEKEPQIKTELMNNFDWKLNTLLSKTNDSFIVIKFPSFNYQVIYEEDISEDYKNKNYKYGKEIKTAKDDNMIWVYDTSLYKGKEDFFKKGNPITDKLLLFSKDEEIKLNPEDRRKIEELLNTPDFIELNNKDIFWKNRYELLRNGTKYALTKIMNSVKWGDISIEYEFFQNILKKWKNFELCDILYMLSRKFSVNKIYINENYLVNDLTCMKNVRKIAVKQLNKYNITELNFILLQLVQAIRYEDISAESYNSPLVNLLINKSKIDINFASSFYWFIECETQFDENSSKKAIEMSKIYNLIKELFLKEMEQKPAFLNIIQNEIEFKDELEEISESLSSIKNIEEQRKKLREIIDKNKMNFMYNEEHYLPIDPRIKIKGVFSEDCTVFGSNTKPIKYTFKVTQDSKKFIHFDNNNYCKLFFKTGDDLRQDQLILQIITYMDSLLKKEQLNYEFTIYKVLSTSKRDGFVEFVPNSKTYKDILEDKRYNKQLKFYYKEISDNQQIYDEKINSFINSLAGYCAVNYILGIGDRHNQNIMFDKKGRLFHIDFGFILGKDPLHYFPFKITGDMVDCMGGKESDNYKKFKLKCKNAYSILRENARIIVNMFYLMIDSGIPELNNIECLKKLHDKFCPNLDKEEALSSFINELETTLNLLLPGAREIIHNIAQYFKY
jgi:phosphatidylinositol 3-kinase